MRDFRARLDFIRPDSRANDPFRQHLYGQFEAVEAVEVPLTLKAVEISRTLPRESGEARVFPLRSGTVS